MDIIMWAIEQWVTDLNRWVLYTAPNQYMTRFTTLVEADAHADQHIIGVYKVVYKDEEHPMAQVTSQPRVKLKKV